MGELGSRPVGSSLAGKEKHHENPRNETQEFDFDNTGPDSDVDPALLAQQRSAVSAIVDSTQESRQAVPLDGKCPNYTEYRGGWPPQNNFTSPFEATTKSPGLLLYFSSNNLTSRNYDQPGFDRAFGCSFFIKCCKVCRAELEIRLKELLSGPNISDNDGMIVGQAPFPIGMRAAEGRLWKPPFVPGASISDPTPIKTITVPLSTAALNSYIFNSDGCKVPIDTYLQDDTAVDYVTLKIWTY